MAIDLAKMQDHQPDADAFLDAQSGSNSDVADVEPQTLQRDDFDRNVWCLLGLPVDAADINQAVAAIDDAVRTRRRLSFVTPNVNWLARASADEKVRREVINADLSLVDGAPLAALARGLGAPIKTRVAGSDLFEALRRRPAYGGRRMKVFFFGGRDGAAEAAAMAVNKEKSGVEAVGWLNPGFGDVADMSRPEFIEEINAAAPDFIIVALGAGKGQAWIDRNQHDLTAPVIAHLGAVVDFTAGGVQRAPKWVRSFALEWAWRIKEEPSLWRRYAGDALTMASLFVSRVAPQWRGGKGKSVGEPQADIRTGGDAVVVRLAGDQQYPDLALARKAFRQAASTQQDIVLDFTDLGNFDRAFLGLVLMLDKHVALRGAKLFIQGANSRQKKVLSANDMRYPEFARDGESVATAPQRHPEQAQMR